MVQERKSTPCRRHVPRHTHASEVLRLEDRGVYQQMQPWKALQNNPEELELGSEAIEESGREVCFMERWPVSFLGLS